MALINCPECSREVSSRAVACPQCGFPIAESVKSATSPLLPDTLECLGCKQVIPFDDHLCPHCGLFNSQKYVLLESLKQPEAEPVEKPDTLIRCPKCGAKNAYHAANQGFGVGKFVAGALLVGPLTGLLAGKVNNNKVIVTCLRCSHKWSP